MLGVIGIGDNVCDKYLNSGYMYPGGQALNVAVFAKQLGVPAAYMGVFGTDEIAAHVLSVLDAIEIDRSHCRHYEGENGYAMVDIVDGERIFVQSNKGGVAKDHPIRLTSADCAYIKNFDLVHTSNNGHFDTQLGLVASLKVPVSYDFSNSWKDPARSREVSPNVSFGFISCGDVAADHVIDACRRLHREGCGIIIATMGQRGSLLFDGHAIFRQEAYQVKAVDTLGAGDSFAAGFLVSLMRGKKAFAGELETGSEKYNRLVRESLENGAAMAAKTCMEHGAFGYGTRFGSDHT